MIDLIDLKIYRTSYYGYLWCTNQLQTGGAPPCTKSMPKFWDLSTGGIPKLNKHIIRLFSHKRWRVNFQRCSAWRHVEKIVQRNIVIFSGQRSRRGLDPSGFFCHRWETTRLEAPFLRWIWSFFWKRHSDSLIYWEAVCIYIMIYRNIFEKPQNRQKKMERGPAVLLRSLTNFETLGATDFDPSQYFILFEMLVVFEFSRVIQFLLVLLAARFLLDSYITLLCIRPIWL